MHNDILENAPVNVDSLLADMQTMAEYLTDQARTAHHRNLVGQLRYLSKNLNPLLDQPATKPPRYKKRRGRNWQWARMQALVRDEGRCVKCSCNLFNKLEVHHKQQVADDGENDLDNLVTLCEQCHELHHKGKLEL